MTDERDPRPDPTPPEAEVAHSTPRSANDPDVGATRLPPVPGPNPPGTESPLDFIRRRTREIRKAGQAKGGNAGDRGHAGTGSEA